MKKLNLAIAAVIVFNFVLSFWGYATLPENLPLHYDLEGNYATTMPSWRLLLYPVGSVIFYLLCMCAVSLFTRVWPALDDEGNVRRRYMLALCLAMSLVVVCSTCVTLTGGSVHFFMFAEPALLLAAIIYMLCREIKLHSK